jgi:hypothetical protein
MCPSETNMNNSTWCWKISLVETFQKAIQNLYSLFYSNWYEVFHILLTHDFTRPYFFTSNEIHQGHVHTLSVTVSLSACSRWLRQKTEIWQRCGRCNSKSRPLEYLPTGGAIDFTIKDTISVFSVKFSLFFFLFLLFVFGASIDSSPLKYHQHQQPKAYYVIQVGQLFWRFLSISLVHVFLFFRCEV